MSAPPGSIDSQRWQAEGSYFLGERGSFKLRKPEFYSKNRKPEFRFFPALVSTEEKRRRELKPVELLLNSP